MLKTIKIPEEAYVDVKKLKKELEKEEIITGVYNVGLSTAVSYAVKKALEDIKRRKRFLSAAGGWADIDGDKLTGDIYKGRAKGTNGALAWIKMYLIDTDICIQFMRNERNVVDFISRLSDVKISIISLSELFFGIYNSQNLEKHKKTLADFLNGVSVLDLDFPVANNFGKIKAKLKSKGSFTGDFDMVNAAFALTYGLTIVTRNIKHYEKIEWIRIKTIAK